ncbi:Cthe_2314 family HEPN domain-containing protein [Lysinibacillus fusiformis]|uniref:Cthe_2314 family HEPN domain-containing protein n=1 Tax=Lysinibacillus fusiformis TaxID=28031 RepID=UPI0021BF1726|nr:Cthe_2314 family HEPN domain-containing protein [Lysinibacillus fusiformis]UXJ68194.1 Cthe_2314 family HEPN domain-containing protein [Lysinibacillus fusiformis]
MVTYKELETSIIYGNAKKPTDIYNEWYDKTFNQPFYDAPCSFFANQSVSLAFSLGEKTAQFVNQLEDINLPITGVSLYKFSYDEKIDTVITPRNSDYKNSVLHTKLKELSDSLTPLKEIRHSKAHRLDSEFTTSTTTVSEGLMNGTEPITIAMSRIDTDRLPITPIQTLEKVKTFFKEATNILDEIFNIAILKL